MLLSIMLILAPSSVMAQTEVGVESETKANVGVNVGADSGTNATAKSETKAEAKTEANPKSQENESSESQQSSEAQSEASAKSETKVQTTVGNIGVTAMGKGKMIVGLPTKYPMPAVSASNSFGLQTNQHLYKPGDMITVEGSIWADLLANLDGGDTVTVNLLDKQRNVVYETKSQITTEGEYSAEFMMPDDASKGAYTITASVNTESDLSSIVGLNGKVNLGASTKVAVVPPQVFKINVEEHGDFDVKVATNSTITDVQFNGDQKKVSVTVEGQSGTKGVSHISIPKAMVSGDLKIMIDGKAVASDKTVITSHTENETEVEVSYGHSVHTIDVIGTQAVPEFGTIATMILVVAIVSIIAVSAKSKLSIVPKL
ncbi:PEFG-CTERM sorting domain-containing protein [Nitrosopumilus sp. SJ]|uniref:PEFG-CTERM sorting domain-containing protein n=1 Tax=Nitrosopumilus sp. SJ TaxID=1027374 RepID=UPI001E51DED7|nr:PEFG-CTERM sorting domain-containing protein [Nitrosopumilus sp. SJ]